MTVMKLCPGCFSQMWTESEKCPKCGWISGKMFIGSYKWSQGDVLEKRYLVGKIYYESARDNIVVFYMYDHVLSIPCMALIRGNSDLEGYIQIAGSLAASGNGFDKGIIVLALKTLQGERVLLFSMRNRYLRTEQFQACLNRVSKEKKERLFSNEEFQGENILSVGTKLFNRYRIIDCIGIGGFGITYLCMDICLNRLVAIKEYFPAEWVERDETYVVLKKSKMLPAFQYGKKLFVKEAAMQAEFIHTSYIPAVYDIFETNDTVYMVMEYINGVSIGRMMRLREYKGMTVEETMPIVLTVLDALEIMHEKGIIHSDISPGNIMYTENKKVFLIDMGAAKNIEEMPTDMKVIFLKTEYAAPEQYQTLINKKNRLEGTWTDIYGVGATMYYMMTGEKPMDVITRMKKPDEELDLKTPYKLPLFWSEVVNEAMALDKGKRIQSVREFRKKIEALL